MKMTSYSVKGNLSKVTVAVKAAPHTIKETVKDRRFWKWELTGVGIYSLPVLYRFITKTPIIPFLDFPYHSILKYFPGNPFEKLVVQLFFPGGAGSVMGEIVVSKSKNEELGGKSKFLARLGGSYLQTAAWTGLQYAGYLTSTMGPHGQNIFEGPEMYPFNFLLATIAPITHTFWIVLNQKQI